MGNLCKTCSQGSERLRPGVAAAEVHCSRKRLPRQCPWLSPAPPQSPAAYAVFGVNARARVTPLCAREGGRRGRAAPGPDSFLPAPLKWGLCSGSGTGACCPLSAQPLQTGTTQTSQARRGHSSGHILGVPWQPGKPQTPSKYYFLARGQCLKFRCT